METRIESESFETLIDFVAFLVQKLWSTINKQSNYLNMRDHNFWTRNPSMSSKVSRLRFSLIFNKNLSETLPSSGLSLGQMKWAKTPKATPFMTSLTKNPKPTTKVFFHSSCKDLPNLLRVWTVLLHNHRRSDSSTKTCANCWILALAYRN